ncbi:hypothetical protein L6164_001036 [Bauhinia variegata]|uniref:Uncharacterized protein n=1 Tax=Bauhinia variegata TaxID=167791 RepID=A0ACB9QAI4_BAUVA|nr:hypothetical protein L6164_001036 [Bauhinia variegata]
MAEGQSLEQNIVAELSNKIDVTSKPINIRISEASPISLHFSNTSNAEGDFLSGFDLNKPPKEFFEVIEKKIQVIDNTSNDSEFPTRSSSSPLTIPEFVDEQPEALETEIHFRTSEDTKKLKTTVESSDQEGPKTEEIGIATQSIYLEPRNPSPEPLVLLQSPSPQDNQSVQGCEAQADQNDCSKSGQLLTPKQKVSPISSLNFIEIIKEPAKEFDGVLDLKIPTIATSNHLEFSPRTSPSTLAIPLHTTCSPSTIKETMEASDEEDPKSVEIEIATVLSDLEPRNLSLGSFILQKNPSLQGRTRVSQTKNYTGEDVKEDLINPREFNDVDLIGLLQSIEEDSNTQAPMPSFSKTAAKNLTAEDNLVAEALADLQVFLKVPLKDIASSKAASLSLENALNFLSCHSFEDGAVSYELKDAIDSLHQDFPSILSSFTQASATIDRFTALEGKEKSLKEELPRLKESVVTLITKIFKTEQKEASLAEQISRLQVELNDT